MWYLKLISQATKHLIIIRQPIDETNSFPRVIKKNAEIAQTCRSMRLILRYFVQIALPCEIIDAVNVMCDWSKYTYINRNLQHYSRVQYIPRNKHTVFAFLCFVVVIHWLIFPYPSGLLHWHCGNLTIAPVPAKQPWWIWINTPCEFIMNDCKTTTKQSTTKPCAYCLGYTVMCSQEPYLAYLINDFS